MAADSKTLVWTGRVLSALPVLLMVVGFVKYFIDPVGMTKGMTTKYGYPEASVHWILLAEAACLLLYVIPQTAVLGAILLTAYLGGAVSTHVRAGEAFVLPIIVAIIFWLGLLLRDRRLRALLPIRMI